MRASATDLSARIARAFQQPDAVASADLFGGSILCAPDQVRPDLWPPRWRDLDCSRLSSSDWNTLSALGLRRYLPALLTAALAGEISCRICAEHLLTDGLLDQYRELQVRWQGISGSWLDMRARHLSELLPDQAALVVEFLLTRRDDPLTMDEARRRIEEALANFWLEHAGIEPAAFWSANGRLPAPERFDPAAFAGMPPLLEPLQLKVGIEDVFCSEHPGDDQIRGSDLGCEPYEVAALYAGKHDWRTLDAAFLDQAGLAFLSPAAFRYYVPAFLLADMAGRLSTQTPSFYLSHGLDNVAKVNRVNPLRYGEITWFEHSAERFSIFTAPEARLIADYLRWCATQACADTSLIEAVVNFWWPKAEGLM